MKAYIAKIIKIIIALAIILAALSGMVYGIWTWLITVAIGKVAAYAIFVSLAMPICMGLSYWSGKMEARAVVTGIDKGIDKLSAAVGLRDNSTAQMVTKVNHWQAAQRADRPNITVQLPGNQLPMITHRQAEHNDILDL